MSNCDTILGWLKEQAENKQPIDPMRYLEAAEKLNAMRSDETDKLIDLQRTVAAVRLAASDGKSAAHGKMVVEASPEYALMKRQESKVKQIEEAIRLAKLHGRLKSEEMRQGL